MVGVVGALADDPYPSGSSGYPSEKKYDGYFQYANVPGDHEYEFGYNRGNPSHYTSRYEQSKDWRFRTKVKWADSYDGYGEHYWEYNHGHHEPSYSAPATGGYAAPAYSEPAPTYDAPPAKY